MLRSKDVLVFDDECNQRLALLLYENKESDFENYNVVSDYTLREQSELWKSWW